VLFSLVAIKVAIVRTNGPGEKYGKIQGTSFVEVAIPHFAVSLFRFLAKHVIKYNQNLHSGDVV